MTVDLHALTFAAHDPTGLARFWGGLLGWEQSTDRGGSVAIAPPTGAGCALRFVPSDLPRTRPNQIHLDLTSESPEAQLATVERALRLGGRHLDIGQGPEEEHVVMADPEGNELCVIEAGNRFLADCGTIGAINCDGSQAVGYFWSKALDWPLVWDQDEETAILLPPRSGSLSRTRTATSSACPRRPEPHQASGGSRTVTQSPPSGRAATVRVPSWASAMLRTMASPRPTPA